MNEMRKLPCGNFTTSTARYLREWRQLTRAVERALDARVYAFDPDIGVMTKDGRGAFSLPLWAAKRIAAAGKGEAS